MDFLLPLTEGQAASYLALFWRPSGLVASLPQHLGQQGMDFPAGCKRPRSANPNVQCEIMKSDVEYGK